MKHFYGIMSALFVLLAFVFDLVGQAPRAGLLLGLAVVAALWAIQATIEAKS